MISRRNRSSGASSCTLGMLNTACWTPIEASALHWAITSLELVLPVADRRCRGGDLDRAVIPAERLAMLLQYVELGADRLGGAEQVARVGILRDQPQRLLFPAARHQDRRVRPGQRLRDAKGLFELVVLAAIRAVVVGPHLLAICKVSSSISNRSRERRERDAQAARLLFVPGGADAEDRRGRRTARPGWSTLLTSTPG